MAAQPHADHAHSDAGAASAASSSTALTATTSAACDPSAAASLSIALSWEKAASLSAALAAELAQLPSDPLNSVSVVAAFAASTCSNSYNAKNPLARMLRRKHDLVTLPDSYAPARARSEAEASRSQALRDAIELIRRGAELVTQPSPLLALGSESCTPNQAAAEAAGREAARMASASGAAGLRHARGLRFFQSIIEYSTTNDHTFVGSSIIRYCLPSTKHVQSTARVSQTALIFCRLIVQLGI